MKSLIINKNLLLTILLLLTVVQVKALQCYNSDSCPYDRPLCIGEQCKHCSKDNECQILPTPNRICKPDGQCMAISDLQCTEDNCYPPNFCYNNNCVECLHNYQCLDNYYCSNSQCLQNPSCESSPCPDGLLCQNNQCVDCTTDSQCTENGFSYCSANNKCQECTQESHCPHHQTVCLSGKCSPKCSSNNCPSPKYCFQEKCIECENDFQCTGNSYCSYQKCVPYIEPNCGDSICTLPNHCYNDQCVQCFHDDQCPSYSGHCSNNQCVACSSHSHCAPALICSSGTCVAGPGCSNGPCPDGLFCHNNYCVDCLSDSDCTTTPGYQYCSSDKKCRQCKTDDHCTGNDECIYGFCEPPKCDTSNCPAPKFCQDNKCHECVYDSQCSGDAYCHIGNCISNTTATCTTSNCQSPNFCHNDECVECNTDAQCQSNNPNASCQNGVCINTGSSTTYHNYFIVEVLPQNPITNKLYLSNIQSGDVEIGVKISVWDISSQVSIYTTTDLEISSKSTLNDLSVQSHSIHNIHTVDTTTTSDLKLWDIENHPTVCIKNKATQKYLGLNGALDQLILVDTCEDSFFLHNLEQLKHVQTLPKTNFLRSKANNKFLNQVSNFQIDYEYGAKYWNFTPSPQEGPVIHIKGFESGSSLAESVFNSENFAAISDQMMNWYVLKGDNPDEVCLLNEQWGAFIDPNTKTIVYPPTKSKICEDLNLFSLTEPIVSDFEAGQYIISTHYDNKHIRSTNLDQVKIQQGVGIWDIQSHQQISFSFMSSFTNEYLEVINDAIETGDTPQSWYIIHKINGFSCIQHVASKKYLSFDDANEDTYLTDSCDGNLKFQKVEVQTVSDGDYLIKQHHEISGGIQQNMGLFNIKSNPIYNSVQIQSLYQKEHLEIDNGSNAEFGKTQDNWLFLYIPPTIYNLDIWCLVEKESGQYLQYQDYQLSNTFECKSRFSLKSISFQSTSSGLYTLRSPHGQQYLSIENGNSFLSLGSQLSIWSSNHDPTSNTITLENLSNQNKLFIGGKKDASLIQIQGTEDPWFVLTGSNANTACLFNADTKKFLKINGVAHIVLGLECGSLDEITYERVQYHNNQIFTPSAIREKVHSRHIIDSSIQDSDAIGLWEFEYETASYGNKKFSLKSAATNTYLGLSNDYSSIIQSFNQQFWVLIEQPTPQSYCLLHLQSGLYISFNGGSILTVVSSCTSGEFTTSPVYLKSNVEDGSSYVIKRPSTQSHNKYITHNNPSNPEVKLDTITVWQARSPITKYSFTFQSLTTLSYLRLTPSKLLQAGAQDYWLKWKLSITPEELKSHKLPRFEISIIDKWI